MTQRSEPPANDFYLDENKNELLYESLLKYISILLGPLTKASQQKKKKKALLGSWTASRRMIPEKEHDKSFIEQLPLIRHPSLI